MSDFISFGSGAETSKQSSASKMNQNTPKNSARNTSLNLTGMPAFGSPAINYGGNTVQFGSPALTPNNCSMNSQSARYSNPSNQQFSPRGMNNSRSPRTQFNNSYSPRNNKGYSPRYKGSNSPRHQGSFQFTSPYRNNSTDPTGFKTPQQFSPGQGRGNGRRSFSQQFQKNTRYDPNSNAGGSTFIEDYYSPYMVQDPWLNLSPVLVQPR